MIQDGQLLNYIGGTWKRSRASEYLDVRNPATAETMVRVPLTSIEEVDEAVQDVLSSMGSPKASAQRNREYLRSIDL